MVIWTARARADLRAIHDYIAKDSRQNAKRVVREIHRKTDTLAETPRLGRVVPELD
jgi:plasmid stabilization system protein ParE